MGPCLPPKRLGPALPAQLGAQCDPATSEWGQAGGGGDPPLPPATPSPPFEASQPPGRPSQRPQWSLGTGLAPGMSGHPRPCYGSVQGLTAGGSGDPGPSRQDGPRRRAVGRRGWGPRSRSWDKRPGLSLLTGAGRGPGPGGRWWLGGRTLCRVRRTVPSQGGPDAPLPGFSGAGSGPRPREKLHVSPANFRRCCPQPRRVETARDSPRPPVPRPAWTPQRPGRRGARGVGEWGRPPYHLHLAGVQLAGGRGHGELDLLAVLGVHGGRGGRWGWGARLRSRAALPLGWPALLRRCAGGGGGGERAPTEIPRRGGRGGGSPPHRSPARPPAALSPRPGPSRLRPRAPGCGSLRPCRSLLPSLFPCRWASLGRPALPLPPSLPLRVSLPRPPSLSPDPTPPPSLGVPARPLTWDWRPGAGWEGSGESGQ